MKVIITEQQYENLLNKIKFEDVYSKTYDNMFRTVCMKYANGDYDTAKEYCQIGYIQVNNKLDKYSGQGSIEGWVRMVIKNTIVNEIRRRQLDTTSDYDFERADLQDTPYDSNPDFYEGRLTANMIRKAVNTLPEGYKKIISLHYFDELSYEEIANQLGINPGTVRSQIFKGKKLLRNKIEQYLKQTSI